MFTNDDCDWAAIPTGKRDDEGEELWDYVPDGSYPATYWETMVMALAARHNSG